MEAVPQPYPDHSASPAPAHDGADGIAFGTPASIADANGAATQAAPPHLLWETLESAFSGPETAPPVFYSNPVPGEERLALYIALPIVLGLSLALWALIIELVLRH